MNMINKVPVLTPVQSKTTGWIEHLACYLNPISGDLAVECEPTQIIDSSRAARRGVNQVSKLSTALKIASYILSAGIFPLLALVTLALARISHKFHWISSPRQEPKIEDQPLLSEQQQEAIQQKQEQMRKANDEKAAQNEAFFDQEELRIKEKYLAAVQKEKERHRKAKADVDAEARAILAPFSGTKSRECESMEPCGEMVCSKIFYALDQCNYIQLDVYKDKENDRVNVIVTAFLYGEPLASLYKHDQIKWCHPPSPDTLGNPKNWEVEVIGGCQPTFGIRLAAL